MVLTHQLLVQSTSFYKSLYQLLFRRHYAGFFLRCWDGSFCGRHEGSVRTRRDTGTRADSYIRTRDIYYVNGTRVRFWWNCQRLQPFIIMSALPPAEHPNNNGQPSDTSKSDSVEPTSTQSEVAEMDTTSDQPPEETWEDIPEEIMELETDDVLTRIRLIDNDIKVRSFHLLWYK